MARTEAIDHFGFRSIGSESPQAILVQARRFSLRSLPYGRLLGLLALAPLSLPAWQQGTSTDANKTAKVCVATVANASTTSAFVERMTARLANSLEENKINAVRMDSSTSNQRKLQPTRENGEESRKKECDYILLTQIVDPRAHPLEPRLPEISIGGRVPSVDASDSRPVSRENLQISFALFLTGRFKPVLDTLLYDRPSANVSDTLEMAMDREANHVSDELKKKHVRPPE